MKDLQLPLDQHVLAILLDYIYKDVTPALDNIAATDFELAMRALIAADLLLINPFKACSVNLPHIFECFESI